MPRSCGFCTTFPFERWVAYLALDVVGVLRCWCALRRRRSYLVVVAICVQAANEGLLVMLVQQARLCGTIELLRHVCVVGMITIHSVWLTSTCLYPLLCTHSLCRSTLFYSTPQFLRVVSNVCYLLTIRFCLPRTIIGMCGTHVHHGSPV